jgi:hypothetical protein
MLNIDIRVSRLPVISASVNDCRFCGLGFFVAFDVSQVRLHTTPAKTLGLTIPPSLFARADEVSE